MSDEQSKRMASFAIEQMFKDSSFNICDVDNACKLMGRSGSGPAYDKLRVLHCVRWGDIPDDIMQLIPIWLNEVLGGSRVSVLQIPALREGNVHAIGFEDTPQLPHKG